MSGVSRDAPEAQRTGAVLEATYGPPDHPAFIQSIRRRRDRVALDRLKSALDQHRSSVIVIDLRAKARRSQRLAWRLSQQVGRLQGRSQRGARVVRCRRNPQIHTECVPEHRVRSAVQRDATGDRPLG